MAIGMIGILIMQGDITYSWNEVVKSDFYLWLDNSHKAPRLSRAFNNLGKAYWDRGFYEEAFENYQKAADLNRDTNLRQLGVVHYNLGYTIWKFLLIMKRHSCT